MIKAGVPFGWDDTHWPDLDSASVGSFDDQELVRLPAFIWIADLSKKVEVNPLAFILKDKGDFFMQTYDAKKEKKTWALKDVIFLAVIGIFFGII